MISRRSFRGDGDEQVRDNVMLEHSSGGDSAREDEPVFLRCVFLSVFHGAVSLKSAGWKVANYLTVDRILSITKPTR